MQRRERGLSGPLNRESFIPESSHWLHLGLSAKWKWASLFLETIKAHQRETFTSTFQTALYSRVTLFPTGRGDQREGSGGRGDYTS